MWWDPYNLYRSDHFSAFWRKHLKDRERRLLFIVGAGFDPRVMGPAKEIIACGPDAMRKCLAIDMSEGYGTDAAASKLGNDARLWELYLFATFAELGYAPALELAIPDFIFLGPGWRDRNRSNIREPRRGGPPARQSSGVDGLHRKLRADPTWPSFAPKARATLRRIGNGPKWTEFRS
jgi:hypothetical protein